MTKYIEWLKKNNIQKSELSLSPGYEHFGRDLLTLAKEAGSYTIPNLVDYRKEGICRFSFAILDDECIKKLVKYSPYLEIGCGTGYWAYELIIGGAIVYPTDPEPYSGIVYQPTEIYTPIDALTAEDALGKYGPTITVPYLTLLTVWPSYDEDWPTEAIKKYYEMGGKRIVYVGEWCGCTANDEFHEFLEDKYNQVDSIKIPQWCGIHDEVFVFELK